MTNLTTYEDDDLIINVPVTFEPGSEITTLTGGTAEALAQRSNDGTVITANAVAITSATNIKVTFNDGRLPAGVYTLQVRATVAGVTQTVAEATVTVNPSI